MTSAQRDAVLTVAQAFGWDRMSADEVGRLAWAAFRYLVIRHGERS